MVHISVVFVQVIPLGKKGALAFACCVSINPELAFMDNHVASESDSIKTNLSIFMLRLL